MKPIPTETATDVGSVGKVLGAAAAGALLMYLFDPVRGSARRTNALSAVREAGARTSAGVDHALHSASDTLAGLKDSAASALSRGADQLQAQAAPVLDRVQRGAREAAERVESRADRARESYSSSRAASQARYNTYESDRGERAHRGQRAYAAERHEGALSQWLHELGTSLGGNPSGSALMGGGVLGMLGLMRRRPTALLLGLAGLVLIMRGSGAQRYKVGAFTPALGHEERGHGSAATIPPATQPGSSYLH